MHTLKGRLSEKKELTPTVLLVRVTLQKPLAFRAGQYVMLGIPLPDGTTMERPFSMAAPKKSRDIEFLVQLKKGSVVPEFFLGAKHGAAVTVRGPLGGSLKLPRGKRPLHFFAAGCGIAPFRAMMKDLFLKDPKSRVRFSFLREPGTWGVIDDELADWYRKCQNFSYSIIHMRADEASKAGWKWRHVDIGLPSHGELVYLAGGSGFVANLKTHLLKSGFRTENILTESA